MNRQRGVVSVWLGAVAMALLVAVYVMAGSAAAQVNQTDGLEEVENCVDDSCNGGAVTVDPSNNCDLVVIDPATGEPFTIDGCNTAAVVEVQQKQTFTEETELSPPGVVICPSGEQCSDPALAPDNATQDQYTSEDQNGSDSGEDPEELTPAENAAEDQYTPGDPAAVDDPAGDPPADSNRSTGLLPASLPTTGVSALALLGSGLTAAGIFFKRGRR